MQFEILTLEELANGEPCEWPIDKGAGYRIIWVKEGNGTFTIDMQSLVIKANMIYFLYPGQICLLVAQGKLEGYCIYLSPEFIHLSEGQSVRSFFAAKYNFFMAMTIQQDDELKKDLEDIILKMLQQSSASRPLKLEILKNLFNIFIIYLSDSCRLISAQESMGRERELVKEFMELLYKNYKTQKMVSEYASALYVSPNYLNRIVKKISGFTARHHIFQAIVLEAKRQAVYSDLSMKEIACFLGFNDNAHFSKFFKNNSGMNFTHYKKVGQHGEEKRSPFIPINQQLY
jgi:AraC family transcriptional regulator, transcriptional activator of pobA